MLLCIRLQNPKIESYSTSLHWLVILCMYVLVKFTCLIENFNISNTAIITICYFWRALSILTRFIITFDVTVVSKWIISFCHTYNVCISKISLTSRQFQKLINFILINLHSSLPSLHCRTRSPCSNWSMQNPSLHLHSSYLVLHSG